MNTHLVSCIGGFGHYSPSNRIDNICLESHFQLKPGWIAKRTGIKSRYWANSQELLVDMAEQASVAAIENSGVPPHKIAVTILATSTPDHLLPPTAPLLAHRLGLMHAGAYDLSAACTGFLYAFIMADGFVRIHNKSVLIVGANILSRRLNLSAPDSATLFGDAAGAIVLTPSTKTNKGLLGISMISDGSAYDNIYISGGGSHQPFNKNSSLNDYKMKIKHGPTVFTRAVKMMTQCAMRAMRNARLTAADLQHFIPHQANERITETVAKKLGIPAEKIISIIHEYGNTSSASIPLALSIKNQSKPFSAGEKILLTAAGAGMTAGAIVMGI